MKPKMMCRGVLIGWSWSFRSLDLVLNKNGGGCLDDSSVREVVGPNCRVQWKISRERKGYRLTNKDRLHEIVVKMTPRR